MLLVIEPWDLRGCQSSYSLSDALEPSRLYVVRSHEVLNFRECND